MKHNNVLQNQHFKKDWQRNVKTWFDQPAAKKRRRVRRSEKAKAVAPRPVGLLRPIVRCCTIKYNMKVKAGRGFTLAELKAAKIPVKSARGVGIAVDHRRVNRSEEGFNTNVQRLKEYKSKLIVFPRKSNKMKKGDASAEDRKAATQVSLAVAFPASLPTQRIKARKITSAEKSANVFKHLQTEKTNAKLVGAREKREKDKAEEAANKKK